MAEEEKTRQEQIHDKGFGMEYNAIKVQNKKLEDVVLDLNILDRQIKNYYSKQDVLDALAKKDVKALRVISNYFYRTDGIYKRTCDYFATMYRYDWYIVPETFNESFKNEKILSTFVQALSYLDASYVKKVCADWALKVIVDGAFYGYLIEGGDGVIVQELPIDYCRTRYSVGNLPAVEFNMRFFDQKFPDTQYRLKVLKMWPKEFQQGYILYKEGKLPADTVRDSAGWYLLEPNNTLKFTMSEACGGDIPIFANAIPYLFDLSAAQELDRSKMMQKLLKIIIQKLPRDKNGDLIFDIDEAADIHQNAVRMLKNTIGIDVLTTFADIESIDLSDSTTSTSTDELEKVERTVYNAMGVSRNLFNTDGNIALEKSILNDEGTVRTLVLQFTILFDRLIKTKFAKKGKYSFRFYMLETTQYNYKDISKMYKEQVQIGYSKMLPQIALGHSQSSIINTAYFENDILKLTEIMIPPLMSSTMSSSDILGTNAQSGTSNQQKTVDTSSESKAGRPEKEDGQKSEKTLQNEESKS